LLTPSVVDLDTVLKAALGTRLSEFGR